MKRRGDPFRLMRQAAFFFFCVAAVYLPITPLAPGADRVAPDVLYCLAVAWVLRDPSSAPVWIILATGLLADVLMARPLGLGALGLVIVTEIARSWQVSIRDTNILVEWAFAIVLFAIAWVATLTVLQLSFSAVPSLMTSLRLIVETSILYVVISLATAIGMRIFGPRRRRGGDAYERARAW
ncbi:MAG: rod shape-determining protein MreD [Pseudomonadota bacterium]